MSTATQPLPAVTGRAELIAQLLKLPQEDRQDLAKLLLDSVREGFNSLEDAAERDKELILSRIEAFERGEMKATDWRESLARVEQQVRPELPK